MHVGMHRYIYLYRSILLKMVYLHFQTLVISNRSENIPLMYVPCHILRVFMYMCIHVYIHTWHIIIYIKKTHNMLRLWMCVCMHA